MSTIKVGMVGLDTSHCPAFAKLLNNPEVTGYVPGCQVVRAFPAAASCFQAASTGSKDSLNSSKTNSE